jgi:hypothetical protein
MGFSDAFNYNMVSTPGFWDRSTLLALGSLCFCHLQIAQTKGSGLSIAADFSADSLFHTAKPQWEF